MNYFVVALFTTSGCAITVYFILNKLLRLRIQVIPIVLCAACSLFLSMALPKVISRYTGLIGTVSVLAVFALILAYLVAYYDEQQVAITSDEDLQIPSQRIEEVTTANLIASVEQLSSVEILSKDLSLEGPNIEKDPIDIVEPAIIEELSIDAESSSTAAEILNSEESLHREEDSLATVDNSTTAENLSTSIPAFESASGSANCYSDISIESEVEQLLTLNQEDATPDILLDRAFSLKEQRNFLAASKLFTKVLDIDRSSDAAPLVILEIADSLQHIRQYDEALRQLTEGLTLPSVTANVYLERELRDRISHLHQLQLTTGVCSEQSETM